MARVKMIRGVLGEDHKSWDAGTEHEASAGFAARLIHHGRAVLVEAKAALPTPREEPRIETRSGKKK